MAKDELIKLIADLAKTVGGLAEHGKNTDRRIDLVVGMVKELTQENSENIKAQNERLDDIDDFKKVLKGQLKIIVIIFISIVVPIAAVVVGGLINKQ